MLVRSFSKIKMNWRKQEFGGDLKIHWSRAQWLMPVILATQEAEIRRITVRSQPGENSS
jgi:hypothetical protein